MENQNPRTLASIMADNKTRDRIEYINKNIGDLYDEQIRIIQGILAGEKIMPESPEHFAYLLMRFTKAVPASVSAATIEKRPRVKISDMRAKADPWQRGDHQMPHRDGFFLVGG